MQFSPKMHRTRPTKSAESGTIRCPQFHRDNEESGNMHQSRLATIVIDCQTENLEAAAAFWSKALGGVAEQLPDPENSNYRQLATPPGEVTVLVQSVSHSSRVHIDIETNDIEAEVVRLESLGARRVAQIKRWWVMEAPTGQRFCVVRPQRSDFEDHANVWR
ncbi:VOC family protein [Polaromonas sp.]|uniref:VOC family protein n=2 Tax=unclassified Polaromonas TaxID=2638319 RepID=UPI002D1FA1D1|nr:VOC family protein [Polaromonas sp.]